MIVIGLILADDRAAGESGTRQYHAAPQVEPDPGA